VTPKLPWLFAALLTGCGPTETASEHMLITREVRPTSDPCTISVSYIPKGRQMVREEIRHVQARFINFEGCK
jgi:hypothetical protein